MLYDCPMLFCIKVNIGVPRGLGGGGSTPFPPKRKKFFQKNEIISEISILSNKFSQKIDKNSIFHWIFIKNFQIFLKISQTIVFVVQKPENLPHGFAIYLQNIGNSAFFAIFFGIFSKFSNILWRPGASAPRTPYDAGALPCTPRNFFLRTPLKVNIGMWTDIYDIYSKVIDIVWQNGKTLKNWSIFMEFSKNSAKNHFYVCCIIV